MKNFPKSYRDYNDDEKRSYEQGRHCALVEILDHLSPKTAEMYHTQKYSVDELLGLVFLSIADLQTRIEKARKIYLLQSKTISDLSQMTID